MEASNAGLLSVGSSRNPCHQYIPVEKAQRIQVQRKRRPEINLWISKKARIHSRGWQRWVCVRAGGGYRIMDPPRRRGGRHRRSHLTNLELRARFRGDCNAVCGGSLQRVRRLAPHLENKTFVYPQLVGHVDDGFSGARLGSIRLLLCRRIGDSGTPPPPRTNINTLIL
jgi:hypothetical protein